MHAPNTQTEDTETQAIFTRFEAAKKLRTSLRTLDYWRTQGKIGFTRIGGRVFFLPRHLNEIINAGNVQKASI